MGHPILYEASTDLFANLSSQSYNRTRLYSSVGLLHLGQWHSSSILFIATNGLPHLGHLQTCRGSPVRCFSFLQLSKDPHPSLLRQLLVTCIGDPGTLSDSAQCCPVKPAIRNGTKNECPGVHQLRRQQNWAPPATLILVLKYCSLLQHRTMQSGVLACLSDFIGRGRSKSINPLWPIKTTRSYEPS